MHNPGVESIDLSGWVLVADDGSPNIALAGSIAPGGFYLLERGGEDTVANITGDLINYGGNTLNNDGETLRLLGPSGETVDSANLDGGKWPAGDNSPRIAMERRAIISDSDTAWVNSTSTTIGLDANGNSITGSPGAANSAAAVPTPTPSSTPAANPTATLSATITPTQTHTSTTTENIVVINEIAWSGTNASSYDEWIELHNPGVESIDLSGWVLVADDGSPNIALAGSIAPGGFYLLERTDDTTVSDIPADLIYSGNLADGGETLELQGPNGEVVDRANASGGSWPAGDKDRRASMERFDNNEDAWGSNSGVTTNGSDSDGNPINGTPKYANSVWFPTPTATTVPPQRIIFNEIAWMGTVGHYNDEWIELFNPDADAINLAGWRITAADGNPDFAISGIIPPWGYFLLERTDDTTISDISADFIYTGSMSNSGELLYLLAPNGEIVDIVAPTNGGWPAGDASLHISMERRTTTTAGISTWGRNTRFVRNGFDVDGYRVNGTPRQRNSLEFPTPIPTTIPNDVLILINEFLPRARYDWNGDGRFTVSDEFIEVVNAGAITVNLEGWLLDDLEEKFTPYEMPAIQLAPGEAYAFFRSETHISLGDDGDTIYLFNSARELVDEKRYNFAKDVNLSWCRADFSTALRYPCWPTPGDTNAPYPLPNREPPPSLPFTPPPAIPPDGRILPKGWRVFGYI